MNQGLPFSFNLVLLANNCIVEQNQRNFTCFQSRVSLSRFSTTGPKIIMIVTKAQKQAFLWLWIVKDCIELLESRNSVRYLGDLENGRTVDRFTAF